MKWTDPNISRGIKVLAFTLTILAIVILAQGFLPMLDAPTNTPLQEEFVNKTQVSNKELSLILIGLIWLWWLLRKIKK